MFVAVVVSQIKFFAATSVFYVSPDNAYYNIHCLLQSCATLRQYLLDNNGTLPVVSNVEYYFLPGEHHLPHSNTVLRNLENFTLVGNHSSQAIIIGCSLQLSYHLAIEHSCNVKISNIIFQKCGTTFYATLYLHVCISCQLKNITFKEFALKTHNAMGNFMLNNIDIEIEYELFDSSIHGMVILYDDKQLGNRYFGTNNTVKLNSSFLFRKGIALLLHQKKYNVDITISTV